MSDIRDVEWTSEEMVWTWPFTPEQVASLTAAHAMTDGMVSIFGVGPDFPDLIIDVSPRFHPRDVFGDGEAAGDEWVIRFGRMRIEDFTALPEHGGW